MSPQKVFIREELKTHGFSLLSCGLRRSLSRQHLHYYLLHTDSQLVRMEQHITNVACSVRDDMKDGEKTQRKKGTVISEVFSLISHLFFGIIAICLVMVHLNTSHGIKHMQIRPICYYIYTSKCQFKCVFVTHNSHLCLFSIAFIIYFTTSCIYYIYACINVFLYVSFSAFNLLALYL